MSTRADVATAIRAVLKSSPTVNQVHVDVPLGDGLPQKGKKRRRQLAGAIAKAMEGLAPDDGSGAPSAPSWYVAPANA